MLSGEYSQSRIERPFIIGLPEAVLFDETFNTDVNITVETDIHGVHVAHYISAELPFGSYASGTIIPPRENYDGSFFLDNIFVADPRLIGTGTGGRLLKSFVGIAREITPEITEMHTGWARLGCVNAIAKAFGSDRLRIETGNEPEKHYGWIAEKPIEQFFVDYPVTVADYQVWSTTTNIEGL